MKRIIIIDDELHAQQILKAHLLKNFSHLLDVVSLCSSVSEGVKTINKLGDIDLVFLDIQMPEENGFELFNYFQQVDFAVVFTTAYSQYALKAIKCSCLDYLLKPIDLSDLKICIERFIQRSTTNITVEKINTLKFNSNNISIDSHSRIGLTNLDGIDFVNTLDIVYCKSGGNYTEVFLSNNSSILVSKPLGFFEDTLSTIHFFRCHRSYIVQISLIDKYIKSSHEIIMSNNSIIPVSSRKKQDLIDALI
jgi:two-component system, LytTR family, response regulator